MTKERTILIRGGTVVAGQSVFQHDLLVRGERIVALGDLAGYQADEQIDACVMMLERFLTSDP